MKLNQLYIPFITIMQVNKLNMKTYNNIGLNICPHNLKNYFYKINNRSCHIILNFNSWFNS